MAWDPTCCSNFHCSSCFFCSHAWLVFEIWRNCNMHGFQSPSQNFIFIPWRESVKVIRKALWDIFIGVSEASKLTTWKNPDCTDRVWAQTLQRLCIWYFDFYLPLEGKRVLATKPNKEGKGTNLMLKNNYSFNFPTNEMWSFKDKG